jgi:MoaA/NifB/PqqE/SkfB family radical SAM enzyme
MPLVGGIPLTDLCNLSCAHCVVKDEGRGHFPMTRLVGWMKDLYSAGVRILYLQGGEILTWRDGDLRPNDVIHRAREMGFFRIAAVTNGTYPIDLEADAVWVSVDGPPETHDAIRGTGAFEKLRRNVSISEHPCLYANITVNRVNAAVLADAIRSVEALPRFKGVSVNFHTPYPKVEHLVLSPEERASAVDTLLRMKKEGHRILNSRAGLRALARNSFPRPVWMIRLIEQERAFECCWGVEQPGVCERCGYGIIAELSAVMRLRPSAIRRAFSLI